MACLKNEHYITSFSVLIWYHRACPSLLFMIATKDVGNETCLNNTMMCMGLKGMSKKWAVEKPTQVVLNQIGNVY